MLVVVMIGMMTAFALPRLRRTETAKGRDAAALLARDLEAVRTRALSTRARARVVFVPGGSQYLAYLDENRDGVIAQDATEAAAVQVFRARQLEPGIEFGRGAAPPVPGTNGTGAITLPGSQVDFDARGLTFPLGTAGVVYLVSTRDTTAVAAVVVTGAAAMRTWTYLGGTWQ